MKKSIKIMLIMFISIIACSCLSKEEKAEKVLKKHLESTYGQEFKIAFMGERGYDGKTWYEAEIYMKNEADPSKENDEYYWAKGFVRHEYGGLRAGDNYGSVLLNESANKFFTPKLEEIFGKQFLPVFKIDGYYEHTDFQKEMARRNAIYSAHPDGKYHPISGGIYLFGRVDSTEEKDEYREKIFEFIQYLKSINCFEYLDLRFYILDERCLTDRFESEVGSQLILGRNNLKTADEFLNYRKELMKNLNVDFKQMSEENKLKKMNSLKKEMLLDIGGLKNKFNKYNNYSVIYHRQIIGSKFHKKESRLDGVKIIHYNYFEDLKLYNTVKVNYEEYNENELYNNEWDGE